MPSMPAQRNVCQLHKLRRRKAAACSAPPEARAFPPSPALCPQETGASLRCIPLAQPNSLAYGFSTCLYSGYQATEAAIFARAL